MSEVKSDGFKNRKYIIGMRLTSENLNILKSYVYMYIDPRNNEIFYIGKGKNGRVYAHLRDTSEHDKTARIAKIRQAGQEPQIDFLRYGLSDSEAMLVEAVAIDRSEERRVGKEC